MSFAKWKRSPPYFILTATYADHVFPVTLLLLKK